MYVIEDNRGLIHIVRRNFACTREELPRELATAAKVYSIRAYQSIHGEQTQMDDATVMAIYKGVDTREWQWHRDYQPQPQRQSYSPPPPPSGSISNARITARNGGVRHQFIDSIGGDSSNYR